MNHNCITYFHTPSGHYHEWQFEEDGKRQSLLCRGTITASNPDILIDAALVGIGIHQSPDFAMLQHLESGALQAVLTKYLTKGCSVWLVYPHDQSPVAKLQVFADFLNELFSRTETRSFLAVPSVYKFLR